jgi:hypothetical protein
MNMVAFPPSGFPRQGLADVLLSPVRKGMDKSATHAAVVRQHVDNLLAALAFGISCRDREFLAELLKDTLLHVEGTESANEVSLIESGAPNTAGLQLVQTVSNVALQVDSSGAEYQAIYQTWQLGSGPVCVAMGSYRGKLTAGPQVWRWVEHTTASVGTMAKSGLGKPDIRANRKPQHPDAPYESSPHAVSTAGSGILRRRTS